MYLPNTGGRAITDADMDLLCETISRSFPSATVQHADSIFDGRFVGIEASGRYIRVYAG
ncbi:hypothetical protein ACUSIJ_14895 [Pseudochelatococcus sp. B33]